MALIRKTSSDPITLLGHSAGAGRVTIHTKETATSIVVEVGDEGERPPPRLRPAVEDDRARLRHGRGRPCDDTVNCVEHRHVHGRLIDDALDARLATAGVAFVVHAVRLWRLDRTLAREMRAATPAAAESDDEVAA